MFKNAHNSHKNLNIVKTDEGIQIMFKPLGLIKGYITLIFKVNTQNWKCFNIYFGMGFY